MLKKFLSKFNTSDKKIPILGIEGSGKTCFAWGLGHFLASNQWGEPTGETAEYFYQISTSMLKNEPIASTYGKRALKFEFNSIHMEHEGFNLKLPTQLVLSTYDISGGDFKNLMRKFSSPTSHPERDGNIKKFFDLLDNSDGLMIVVDLARRILQAEDYQSLSKKEKEIHLLNSLAEQVMPLCIGIEQALRVNKDIAGKPLFFIFTKADIHGLSLEMMENLIRSAYSVLLARLENKGVIIKFFKVAYRGTEMQEDGVIEYGIEGAKEFLYDMAMHFHKNTLEPYDD